FDASVPEAARHDQPVQADEGLDVAVALEALAIDPGDLHVAARRPGGVLDRLGHRQIGVGQLDVFPDEPDSKGDARATDALGERAPLRAIRLVRAIAQPELVDTDAPKARFLEHEPDRVARPRAGILDDA